MACAEPDCTETKLHGRGLCHRHYAKWRRGMDRGECSIEGCTNRVESAGLCNRHYHKLRKYRDPLASKTGGPAAFIERALAHVSDDCLPWPFHLSKGYGKLRWNGRMVSAHRLVAELTYGPPPAPEMVAAHAPIVCHQSACVNPRHLRWATHVENHRDMDLDHTSPVGERSGGAKLTEAQVLAIRADDRPSGQVAVDYGVSSTRIAAIRAGRAWRHLTEAH